MQSIGRSWRGQAIYGFIGIDYKTYLLSGEDRHEGLEFLAHLWSRLLCSSLADCVLLHHLRVLSLIDVELLLFHSSWLVS